MHSGCLLLPRVEEKPTEKESILKLYREPTDFSTGLKIQVCGLHRDHKEDTKFRLIHNGGLWHTWLTSLLSYTVLLVHNLGYFIHK